MDNYAFDAPEGDTELKTNKLPSLDEEPSHLTKKHRKKRKKQSKAKVHPTSHETPLTYIDLNVITPGGGNTSYPPINNKQSTHDYIRSSKKKKSKKRFKKNESNLSFDNENDIDNEHIKRKAKHKRERHKKTESRHTKNKIAEPKHTENTYHNKLSDILGVAESVAGSQTNVKDEAKLSSEEYYLNQLRSKIIAQSLNGPMYLPVMTINLSFCGAGFLGIYHLGVAKALVCHGAKLMLNVQNYIGASAGILVSALLAVKNPDQYNSNIDKCIKFSMGMAELTRKKKFGALTPRYSLLATLEELLQELIPEDGHEKVRGRLHVSMTRLKCGKNTMISEFRDKQHLIKCLLASSYVPFATGTHPYQIDGHEYIDGGFTDNLPRPLPGRTITVSAFSGKEDICPVDTKWTGLCAKYAFVSYMTTQTSPDNARRGIHAFLPPNHEGMEKYFNRGFTDTVRFLKRERFYTP